MSVNCHIGIDTLNDGKIYGLRLYKKIGSGSWTLVSGAQGFEDTGYIDSRDICWIAKYGVWMGYRYCNNLINQI